MEFKDDTLLLVPILEHIKYLRKPIKHQSVSYYSEEDQLNVYVGIEGVNINPAYAIPVQELKTGQQFKLTLFIKQTDDINHKKIVDSNPEVAAVVEESQQIVLSLPDMVTKSQFDDAITGIIKPIQKERCSKEEAAKRNVSIKKRFWSRPVHTHQITPQLSHSFECHLQRPADPVCSRAAN